MSELVVGLEAAGFVQRVPDPADGRAKLICLTPLGRRVVRRAVEEIANIEAAWFQQMRRVAGSDELRALLQRVVCDKRSGSCHGRTASNQWVRHKQPLLAARATLRQQRSRGAPIGPLRVQQGTVIQPCLQSKRDGAPRNRARTQSRR
jgi:hypothetical protein